MTENRIFTLCRMSSVSQNVLKFYQQLTGEERKIPFIFDDFHFFFFFSSKDGFIHTYMILYTQFFSTQSYDVNPINCSSYIFIVVV